MIASSKHSKQSNKPDRNDSFEEELPNNFEDYQHQRLLKRVPAIGWAGIAIFLAYTLLDYYTLPIDVSAVTVSIRLFIVCPMIGLVLLAAHLKWPPGRFSVLYLSAYVIAGCSIVAIIYTARSQGVDLPYDGLLLLMVFGYFLMGMPQRHASTGSIFVSVVYFVILYILDSPAQELASNALFITTLNVLGTLGSALQDRSRQQLFRNEHLVARAQAKDKAEIASKTRLLATASHDLRQPLHAMNLLVETLEHSLEPGKHKDLAQQLKNSTRQLNSMLSSLLDMSRLQTGVVDARIKPFNLSERLQFLARELSLRAERSGLSVELQGAQDCWVESDPVLLERILRNVCENSFVHSQAKHLKLSWHTDNRQVLLSVEDDGVGFEQTQSALVFEAFQRLKSRARTGMGLGLAIVKQLCETLDIDHGVRSEPGKGACFWFKLDGCAPIADHSIEQRKPKTSLAKGKRIAVVDDDLAILESTANLLTNWGFETFTFSQPELALAALETQAIDLLISDFQFPDYRKPDELWNGLDLIQEIRKLRPLPLPAIIVTADTQADLAGSIREDFDSASQALTQVLYKPFSPAKLRLVIRHYLDQQTTNSS